MHRIIYVIIFMVMIARVSAQNMSLFDKLLFAEKGDTLPYRLLKPVNPGSMPKFPLVIFLHGVGERGTDNEVQTKHISELFLDERNRGKYPCYLVAPQCPKGYSWSNFKQVNGETALSPGPSKPMKLLISLIESIIKEFPVDESRIYVTGLSMGGFGTFDLIARYPEKFAAAVPVCGGGDPKTAGRIKHIPIWAFHGALDKTVTPQQSRRMISALQKEGATPGYTEYPDVAHDSWVYAYREPHLIHWLFNQTRVTKSNVSN